jgi:GntR family transcriptional regulator/MocR family aminotransferase
MPPPYVLELPEDTSATPLHVRIAQAIADDIARGRLLPQARLPGSRSLAQQLGVHRNTVNAAFAELIAQGWLEAKPARGCFVRATEPGLEQPTRIRRARAGAHTRVAAKPGFDLSALAPETLPGALPKLLILSGGVPDPRLFPHALLARAYRRVLRSQGSRLLDYGDPLGERSLRQALADMLKAARGLSPTADEVMITRGSQQALWLSAHALVAPGDRVGVEAFGYPPAWSALRSAGAELVPLEIDRDGVRPESVARALQAGPLKALYLTPHHQYPTMVALSPQRRPALLALAKRHRFAILEDDYSNEFQFEGRPRLPMASSDPHGNVVYLGGLSKVLAPGLRIGYVVAPRPLLERMAQLRVALDRQGDAAGEAAVAELLVDGDVARHARRMREVYRVRRDVLVETLARELKDRVSFDVPQGGMALWVGVHGVDPKAWAERSRARGVVFRAGQELNLSQLPVPYVRMGFTRLDERELVKAVREVAKAWK